MNLKTLISDVKHIKKNVFCATKIRNTLHMDTVRARIDGEIHILCTDTGNVDNYGHKIYQRIDGSEFVYILDGEYGLFTLPVLGDYCIDHKKKLIAKDAAYLRECGLDLSITDCTIHMKSHISYMDCIITIDYRDLALIIESSNNISAIRASFSDDIQDIVACTSNMLVYRYKYCQSID